MILAIGVPVTVASADKPVTYDDDEVYVAKVITRHLSDGNYKSWIVVHAGNNTDVNHLAVKMSNDAKLVSVQNVKNWLVWHDSYTIDLHAQQDKFIRSQGLVIRIITDAPPAAQVATAMHH